MKKYFFFLCIWMFGSYTALSQDSLGYIHTINSLNKTLLKVNVDTTLGSNILISGLPKKEEAFYNIILLKFSDSATINKNFRKSTDVFDEDLKKSLLKIMFYSYHTFLFKDPKPLIKFLKADETEMQHTLGIYENGNLKFIFKFNPVNNKIIGLISFF